MKDFPHDQIVAAAIGVFDCVQGKTPHTQDVPDAPGGAVVVDLKGWRKERENKA